MKRIALHTLLAAGWLLGPAALSAATHDVTVGDSFFSPNDLTIQVGDTVRWTAANTGMPHDVTADDFSWNSPTSNNFVFERTFNTVEEVLYHCTVHSSPGMNINTFMNGRITVEQANGSDFVINTALSDAWYDPATDGQGFFIIVWEDAQTVFLSWFTYDTERPPQDVMAILGEPGHRWLTAQGGYAGDTVTLDVHLTAGGVFDAPMPVPDPAELVGSMTIVWTGCNAGTLSYDLPDLGLSGDIPIQRIVLDNVPACEAAQPQ
jgi:plastocyanin